MPIETTCSPRLSCSHGWPGGNILVISPTKKCEWKITGDVFWEAFQSTELAAISFFLFYLSVLLPAWNAEAVSLIPAALL